MKYKCSLNSCHEIIGLCDLEEFNKKICAFKENSWTQVSIPQVITVKQSDPNINKITKVYIDIEILSTRILKTPYSQEENYEGNTLTGKILSIFGCVNQKILYTSDKCDKSMYYTEFKSQLNANIALDKNVDIYNDKFCVYPCVENIFTKTLNPRSIIQNITLFLFAHKIPAKKVIKNKLPTDIIVYSEKDTEVLKIQFDKDTQKLAIDSTGEVAYPDLGQITYFSFDLRDEFGVSKIKGSINAQDTGDKFAYDLNDASFEYTDSIKLTYVQGNKISITNFPVKDQIYQPKGKEELFSLSSHKGLINYVYENELIIDNLLSKEMARVQFNISDKQLNITSTQETIRYNPSEEYFGLVLLDGRFNLITQGSIMGLKSADDFKNELNNKPFAYNNFLKLRYKNQITKIIVTNFNKQEIYNPLGSFKFFSISKEQLVSFNPTFLKNIITLKTKDNIYVFNIGFITNANILLVEASGAVNNDSTFTFKLLNSSGIEKLTATIKSKEVGDKLLPILDCDKFAFGDIILLEYSDNKLVEISNFPTSETAIYNPKGNAESFVITPNGLQPFEELLPNVITLKTSNNLIAKIKFNKLTKSLIVESTGEIISNCIDPKSYIYFELPAKNMLIPCNVSAENFALEFNGVAFNYNETLRIGYYNRDIINITNYPSQGQTKDTNDIGFESYTITPNGLKPKLED